MSWWSFCEARISPARIAQRCTFLIAGLGSPFGTVMGGSAGLLLGLEYRLRPYTRSLSYMSDGFAILRGALIGVAGAVAFSLRFGLVLAVVAAAGLLLVYRLGFSVSGE